MELTKRGDGQKTEHAVVLGASVSGLCAARVLADFFERVTVVERDVLPSGFTPRKGVPQGHHVHSLVLRGARIIEGFFPGFSEELVADGGTPAKALTDLRISFFGSLLQRVPIGSDVIQASRPFLEGHLRRRVAALGNVTVLDGMEAIDILTAPGKTVTGVRLGRPGSADAPQEVAADLVVDAMGRGGRGAAWLEAMGYARPKEEGLRVDVTYVSRHYRLPPAALGTDKAVLVGPTPQRPRGLVLTAQEGDGWVLSLYGYGAADRPPLSPEETDVFVKEIAPPDVWDVLQQAEPLDDAMSFRVPATVRRRYDKLRHLPDGLLSIGDAVCALNPIYGTGMTAAALEAEALRACLERGMNRLPRRYYRSAARRVRLPWLFAMLADKALPQVPGSGAMTTRVLAELFLATMRAAATDSAVAERVWNAVSLTGSPIQLGHPRVIAALYRNRSQGSRRIAGAVAANPAQPQ